MLWDIIFINGRKQGNMDESGEEEQNKQYLWGGQKAQ